MRDSPSCSSSSRCWDVLSGVMFAYAGDLPLISELDDYAPSAITRVYAVNGETLGEFATERRLVISYDDISPYLRNAIISAEDKDFNNHFGLSVSAMLVAAQQRHRSAGAWWPARSTLTMQLARGLFAEEVGFTLGDKSPERKIKEILVAIQIEKRYTKREILTFYCNQMHLRSRHERRRGRARSVLRQARERCDARGSRDDRRHHPDAGAAEPVRQSRRPPSSGATTRCSRWPTTATSRRSRQTRPSRSRSSRAASRSRPRSVAPFFTEEVRKYLEQKYGAKALYEERTVGADRHRHQAAARGQSRGRSRPSHRRQAARLPPRQAEHRRAGAEHRDLQARALGSADRRRRHRPGGRR